MLTKLYFEYFSASPPREADKDPPFVEENGPYVYDPERPSQREIVLADNAEHLHAIHLDKTLQIKKWKYMVCCSLFGLLGAMLTLWGFAETILFNSYQKNILLVWISIPFYIPFFIWLKVLFCPSSKEYSLRQYVMEKRFWRQKVAETQYKVYMGYDEETEENKAERRRADELKLKIGKNKPKLGQVDKSVYKPKHLPNQGLNIVLDRQGRAITRPPDILPQIILDLGTAPMLPDYSKNRYDSYAFNHPDPDGEAYGFEANKLAAILKQEAEKEIAERDNPSRLYLSSAVRTKPSAAPVATKDKGSFKNKKNKKTKKPKEEKSVQFFIV